MARVLRAAGADAVVMPILWTDDGVMPMRDKNIDLEASRYDPEPGTRLLTSTLVLALVILCATLLMVGGYLTAVKVRSQQSAELTR